MIAERVTDVVTVEVIRNALNAAADEMGTNLARSAYTPIIYEMKDTASPSSTGDSSCSARRLGFRSFSVRWRMRFA